jgi:prepilin signal peptidase PulO-like enzyme (type II secretory pathway)
MFYYLTFFVIGLFFGSFLNVVICRFPEMKDIFFGRSYCPKCKKTISFYDLIPLLSYLILLGRCRSCGKPISIQYPIVEIITGLLFALSYYISGFNFLLIFYLPIFMLLILIFVYDLKHLEIPEVFSWLFLALAILAGLFANIYSLDSFLLGGLIGGGILGILVGISDERWMGSGDIKIGLGFGFLLGYPRALLFLLLSFVIGSLIGVFLILLKKGKLKSQVPFAPFLIISAIITLIYGQQLIDLYLNFAIM